ncbi:glyoxalase [Photobacterium frigidiphilum]|uniref:Glyoxalase n=1 Tax=Photobacterium frigidiphilum TaxID=264736 RepID=A0A2T3J6K1_9GAMM|nr:VOC family protein [Photobacterium frigidiphilum]PSU43444.1 glyoxalase [Photobacterium frigidiphilum]
MKIEHIAIWTKDLEAMKSFYQTYFNATSNDKYVNSKGFSSYFLSFNDGARIELMKMDSIPESKDDIYQQYTGLIHLAFSVGSEDKVNEMTARFKQDGFEILDGPRKTGDGYYESVVLDPEGNRLEITS